MVSQGGASATSVWGRSKALLGSISGVERARVSELQNPEPEKPLAPHWRVPCTNTKKSFFWYFDSSPNHFPLKTREFARRVLWLVQPKKGAAKGCGGYQVNHSSASGWHGLWTEPTSSHRGLAPVQVRGFDLKLWCQTLLKKSSCCTVVCISQLTYHAV